MPVPAESHAPPAPASSQVPSTTNGPAERLRSISDPKIAKATRAMKAYGRLRWTKGEETSLGQSLPIGPSTTSVAALTTCDRTRIVSVTAPISRPGTISSRPLEVSNLGLAGARRLRFSRLAALLAGSSREPSLGALFLTLLPQYGHSVMYGLTLSPHEGHTTERSGVPLATDRE